MKVQVIGPTCPYSLKSLPPSIFIHRPTAISKIKLRRSLIVLWQVEIGAIFWTGYLTATFKKLWLQLNLLFRFIFTLVLSSLLSQASGQEFHKRFHKRSYLGNYTAVSHLKVLNDEKYIVLRHTEDSISLSEYDTCANKGWTVGYLLGHSMEDVHLQLTSAGNPIVAGSGLDGTKSRMALFKFSKDGQSVLWAKTYLSPKKGSFILLYLRGK